MKMPPLSQQMLHPTPKRSSTVPGVMAGFVAWVYRVPLTTLLLMLVWLAALPGASQAQSQCNPRLQCCPPSDTTGGSTCGGQGPASAGNTSGVGSGGGNPIDILSGNKHQREVDMAPLPGVMGLEIVRHYNSVASGADRPARLFGRGWKLSYETELIVRGGPGGARLDIVQADGTTVSFSRSVLPGQSHLYVGGSPTMGHVIARTQGAGMTYVWMWANGRQLHFNADGRLTQIAAPSGETVQLLYDPRGGLVRVTDPQGRSLHLKLTEASAGARLSFASVAVIDSPVGRFAYTYGSPAPEASKDAELDRQAEAARLREANLVQVSLPTHHDPATPVHGWTERGVSSSSIRRLYHYEDSRWSTLLTGISVEGQGSDGRQLRQRVSTWAYDAAGRARLSVRGELPPAGQRGIEQVEFEWQPEAPASRVRDGRSGLLRRQLVVLTNSLGQRTVYTTAVIAGQRRIVRADGPGCATCSLGNMRYAYDEAGRLIEQTQSRPDGTAAHSRRFRLDGYGRVMQESVVEHDAKGEPGPERWQVRYTYARFDEQVAQAAPGGPDYMRPGSYPVLIERPSVVPGQVQQTHIRYNGVGQPVEVSERGFSPLNNQGQPDLNQPTAIQRSTIYRYEQINGRSLLVQIDGPLPNGPKADPSDSDITRIAYDKHGNTITRLTQPGNRTSTLSYDSAGRVIEVRDAQGFATRQVFDPRGQLTRRSRVAPSGEVIELRSILYDALGHAVEHGTGETGTETYKPEARQGFDVADRVQWHAQALGILSEATYDSESRLIASRVRTSRFEQSETYTRDREGRITELADNAGRVQRMVYDEATGRPLDYTDAMGRVFDLTRNARPQVPNRAVARLWRDDFGRVVRESDPVHGLRLSRYDEAGRLVAQENRPVAAGAVPSTSLYGYDLQGRLIRRAVQAPNEGERVTQWRYDERHLVEVIHPEQTERYRRDDAGRLIERSVSLRLVEGHSIQSTMRDTLGAQGLERRSLPDGSRLVYERNGQGQVIALYRQAAPWAPFGWGRTALATDLRRDLVGLSALTYGNGIQAQWQRSKEGVLARVVYRQPEGRANGERTASRRFGSFAQLMEALIASAQAQANAQQQAASPVAAPAPGALGLPTDPRALYDARLLYDPAGNVLLQSQHGAGVQRTQAYAYDGRNQLIAAQRSGLAGTTATMADQVWRYHHDAQANRVLAQEQVAPEEMGQTRAVKYHPVTSAALTKPEDRRTTWDAEGQLTRLEQSGKRTQYRYGPDGLRVSKQLADGRGEHYLHDEQRQRTADLDGQGRVLRQYVWLGDKLIATLDASRPELPRAPAEDLWEELMQTATVLWRHLTGESNRLVFVHASHLGAPIAATDTQGQTVWQVDHAPYGKLIAASNAKSDSYSLDLRYAGQWQDEESGLYYNDARYYDPDTGRYLSPDPLGPLATQLGATNAYGYVNNNPISYIDPLGLVLFAFDGTGNTNNADDLRVLGNGVSNVWRFYEAYRDPGRRYVSGVGTVHREADRARYEDIVPDDYARNTRLDFISGRMPLHMVDMGANYSGPARIARMEQYFQDEADAIGNDEVMQVDIIGFSRGAAQARAFANLIAASTHNGYYQYTNDQGETSCQRVNFRFMGLFDTVLSTNWSGANYQLGIPAEFQHVAQAVALNEYRSSNTLNFLSRNPIPYQQHWGGFPLESITGSPAPEGRTRIEMGFLGSHADIGGGLPG